MNYVKGVFFIFSVVLLFGIVIGFILGCRDLGCRKADSFFSGRPSGMSKVHNALLDGTLDSIITLLRVPHRFPEANEIQKASWQGSIASWWSNERVRNSFPGALRRLTREEIFSLETWVTTNTPYMTKKESGAMNEIAAEIKALHLEQAEKR